MPDEQKTYSLAVQLYQELLALESLHPDLKQAISLADKLTVEMGWYWVNQD